MVVRRTGSGWEEFRRQFEQGVESLRGGAKFEEVFNAAYMRANTPFDSLEALLESGGLRPSTQEEFESLDEAAVDALIVKHTRFRSWKEFATDALEAHLAKKLGFEKR